MRLSNTIRKFWVEEDGLETLEWAILGGVIIIGAVAAYAGLGDAIARVFGDMQEEVESAEAGGSGSGT